MKRIEIMAPAGNLEILKAAVDVGADAVYIGLGAYNARMNAENFTLDTLVEGVKYAHYRSSRVYLTLNTLVNDYELDDALSVATSAYETGVDGIIIQDIGLASKIRRECPDIPLICSTQMNIFSYDDLSALVDLGYSRVVLSRELSMDEIRRRTRLAGSIGLETEVFAHGAICVSCSGLCLFSSMNKSGSRSGNRGMCAQPCRQEYDMMANVTKIKSGHLLSPKDRSVIPYLTDLIESGVSSIKIEGRMRDINYVVSATKAYRILVDAYYDGSLNEELEKSVQNDLLVSFNRGGSFTSHYLSGKKDSQFLSGDYVGKYGLRLGFVTSTDSRKGTITFTYDDTLPLPSKGDYLSIRLGSIELCSFPIGKVHELPRALCVKGLHPDMIAKIPDKKPSVYLMSHVIEFPKGDNRKTPVDLSVDLVDGILSLNAKITRGINSDICAYYDVDIPTDFDGAPLSNERVIAQLSKTGDTPFVINKVFFVTDKPIACKISLINELRRGLIEQLLSEIDYKYERNASLNSFDMFADDISQLESYGNGSRRSMHIFPSFKRIQGDLDRGADMYAFSFYDLQVRNYANKIFEFIKSKGAKLVVMMPDFYHDKLADILTDVLDNVKANVGDLFYAIIDSRMITSSDLYSRYNVKHFLSASANVLNKETIRALIGNSDALFISYELSCDEFKSMANSLVSELVDYEIILHSSGPIPWMQSSFCPIGEHKNGCRSCYDNVRYSITVDSNKECEIVSRPFDCSSVIYGPAKNQYDNDAIDELTDIGLNIISVDVEL